MIQLATDPHASRTNWRPAPDAAQDKALAANRRSGHAWPFISRLDDRPVPQDSERSPREDNGS